MAIVFHERTEEFHLYNREISYIMKLLPDRSVGQLYYGKRIRDRGDYGHMLEYAVRDMAPCPFEGDNTFPGSMCGWSIRCTERGICVIRLTPLPAEMEAV